MIRILGRLTVGIGIVFATLQAGIVEATVDHSKVVRGDSVKLSIKVTGEKFDSLPDVSTIAGVDVLNSYRSQGSRYTYINGQEKMEISETLIIEFQPDKNITIPPFEVKVDGKIESSEPIFIEVVEPSNQIIATQKFSLDIKLNKKSVYLGEPLIATVSFRQRRDVDVMHLEYQEPSFKSFFSKLIDKERTYNDGDCIVHEVKYQLIAKSAGKLTLDAVRTRVAEPVRKRDFIGFITTVPKWTNLSTGSRTIEVKKPHGDYDVVGSFQLSDSVDTQKVKANKPVNLTITLEGKGSLEDYEGVEFDIPGVTIYKGEPKVDTKLVSSTLQTTYSINYVFISDHDFAIPSKQIKAFDYKTHSIKTLTTNSYNIEVEGGNAQPQTSIVHTKEPTVDTKSKEPQAIKSIAWSVPSWWMLLLSFILGAIVALLAKHFFSNLNFNLKGRGYKESDALTILYPHIHESDEVEMMVRKLYKKRAGKKVEIDKAELKRLVELYRSKEVK